MNKRTLIRRLLPGIVFFLFVVAAFILRKHGRPPFFWFFLCLGGGTLVWAVCIRQLFLRYCFILLFSFCLALAGGELYFHLGKPKPVGENYRTYKENGESIRWIHDAPVTGYLGKPSSDVQVTSVKNSNLVYDVVYSTDKQGWRKTPLQPEATEAVVFFGCSFVFGEGLNAEQTFVQKTGELLGPQYQIFNYGFSGYGPHQFLALLQSGILDPVISKYDKVHVYYLSLRAHDLRCAGYSSWDIQGPWYEVDGTNAVLKGTFKDRKGSVRNAFDEFFRKSALYGLVFDSARKNDSGLRELHTAILRTAVSHLNEQERVRFTLALWPDNELVKHELAADAIRFALLDTVLPGYKEDPALYQLAGDGHPNEYASTLLARFFAEDVQKDRSTASGAN